MNESPKLQTLVEEFPTLYPPGFQFYALDGWYDLLHNLSMRLVREPIYATQVKEKFAGLRFYFTGELSPEGRAAIKIAIEEASRTCEWCGGPGLLRASERHWFRTSCEAHADGTAPCPGPARGEQAGSGLPKILSAWKGQHWRVPDLEERTDPDHTLLFLTQASLMSEETLAELDQRVGASFRSLPDTARLALATALLEGEVTHDRLKTVTGLHRTDLTLLLRDLARQGLLLSEGRGRGTRYHLMGDPAGPGTSLEPGDAPPSEGNSQHNEPDSQHNGLDSQHNGEHNGIQEVPSAEWEELMSIAAAFRGRERASSADQVRGLILDLARDRFLTLRQLAQLLDRTEGTLQNHYLRDLVKTRELELRFLNPNHPQQAYRTRGAP